MDYSVKIVLPRQDRNEYITHIHLKGLSEEFSLEAIKDMALCETRRRPWLRLSDIEKTKIQAIEVKTL